MLIPQQLYGIIGHPLGHSQSPRIHNAAFAAAGLPKVYMAWPTPPEKLEAMVECVRLLPIAGLSVTIPHKEHIIPLLDAITPAAKAVGAVNTVYWQDGALCGDNTDVAGFMAPLSRRDFSCALVLGAGGACRAVLAGLQHKKTPRIVLCNHNSAKAMALAQEFQVEFCLWEERHTIPAGCIINATPLGMRGSFQDQTPYDSAAFEWAQGMGERLAYDLVYNPLHTRFLEEALAAGWDIQDGLDMFVAQANEQFRIWTGQEFDQATVRANVLKNLEL